jgi:hypothetical protein
MVSEILLSLEFKCHVSVLFVLSKRHTHICILCHDFVLPAVCLVMVLLI